MEREKRKSLMEGGGRNKYGLLTNNRIKKHVKCKKKSYLAQNDEMSSLKDTDGHYMDNFNTGFSGLWPGYGNPQQRLFTTSSDPSVCRYSVPLSFSLEPVSLPVYPALFHPSMRQGTHLLNKYPTAKPLSKSYTGHLSKSEQNGKKKDKGSNVLKKKSSLKNDGNEFASLPPTNNTDMSLHVSKDVKKDKNGSSKRRFSDPGFGLIASDNDVDSDSNSSRSESADSSSSSNTVPTDQNNLLLNLTEQINFLKESNRQLFKKLHETQVELQSCKLQTENWKICLDEMDYQPGKFSIAVKELRDATNVRDEVLLSKMKVALDESLRPHINKVQQLEQRLCDIEGDGKVAKLEQQLEQLSVKTGEDEANLVTLEQEKLKLRKELQEAVTGRINAEENSKRLERLVDILRKNINGVTGESCTEQKPNYIHRSISSTFELNPFIIANKNSRKKLTDDDKLNRVQSCHEAELENGESSDSISSSGSNISQLSSLPAQVTITGPVTDL